MADCFVVFRDGDNVPHIYEFVGDEIQLIDRRTHKAGVDGKEPISVVEALERQLISNPEALMRTERRELSLGSYHPSIGRPVYPDMRNLVIPNSDNEVELAKSIWREIDLISKDMERCFNVTTISERNFESFGIEYERIIYFCCIGVEFLFRKILVANGNERPRMTMNDFVALYGHLRLNEFGLSLVRYPWIPKIFPFAAWSRERPSESLPWFSAYNALKHDKKTNERLATMRNALSAFAGYYAIAYVALAKNLFPGFLSTDYYFHIDDRPAWDLNQLYFAPNDGVWRPSQPHLG